MYVMYDSIEVATVPRGAQAVAGYVGGYWPTFGSLVREFPNAHHLSIAVNAGENAEALDVEAGDARPEQAGEWVKRQIARGVRRPVVYASASAMLTLVADLRAAGLQRSGYRLWSAHYNYSPHICGHGCGYPVTVDATQWTDRALGRNLDESLCLPSFFGGAPTPTPAPASDGPSERQLALLTPDERGAVRAHVAYSKHPELHRHGLGVVAERIVGFRKSIWLAAEKGRTPDGKRTRAGWDVRNRRQRYALLWAYSR